MSIKKTLGGNRLGAGNNMKVSLHNYERSTHDLSYIWRSSMAPGTLVPFMSQVALPGDTFDIDLDADVKTHPTIGPLFGSYKIQLDVFLTPIRLYNSLLHNNALGVGMQMSQVKLPIITMQAASVNTAADRDNAQINPSSLLAYLGYRGVGNANGPGQQARSFNAVPILCYYDIFKNYYAHKMETNAYFVSNFMNTSDQTVIGVLWDQQIISIHNGGGAEVRITPEFPVEVTYSTGSLTPDSIIFGTQEFGEMTMRQLCNVTTQIGGGPVTLSGVMDFQRWGNQLTVLYWRYLTNTDPVQQGVVLSPFPLSDIDKMRNEILKFQSTSTPFDIDTGNLAPYSYLNSQNAQNANFTLSSQYGLCVKTYQSDLFNNWLTTEWIDGPTGISQLTAIDTTGGKFTIDTLNLSKKVYDMLNRIAVSGGSYDDWLDAVYSHPRHMRAETPMYMGGLIKELAFQEVVNNSEAPGQPLGTLAGKGHLTQKHKGGKIVIKVDEPSYIHGIISLTPRIDYSQGNSWDINLQTLNDLHKPALDEIGFQELVTEQLAWWDTKWNGSAWVKRSAGKQPAWLNYMTNVNRCYGNFAIGTGTAVGEMFMTLNRRYSWNGVSKQIGDLTTYIDPSKFNFIFAETALDAQNFWAQIGVNITARRKMSAKLMPNL